MSLPSPPGSDGPLLHGDNGNDGIDDINAGHEVNVDRSASLGRANKDDFNIFRAIIDRPDLLVHFVAQLEITELVSLYAISRDFHDHVDGHFTTAVVAHANLRAQESAQVFHFKAYKSLCRRDPAMRPHPRRAEEARLVPSFRWLRMVLYRERVVTEIIQAMAEQGLHMPNRTSLTIKRMWLTLDVATNAKRIGLVHNTTFWTDVDLYLTVLFCLKLDMLFNSPLDAFPMTNLRCLLLGQKSLTPLWKAITGSGFTSIEFLQMLVRYSYRPAPAHRHMSILGMPPNEIGIGCREGGLPTRDLLLRPEELALREMRRRQLTLDKEVLIEMGLWGTVDFNEFDTEHSDENNEFDRPRAAPNHQANPAS